MRTARLHLGVILIALGARPVAAAPESIEFVSEHLAEIAMDNRYASLPLWGTRPSAERPWQLTAQLAASRTSTGTLSAAGPLASVGLRRALNEDWHLTGFVFFDDLDLSSGIERRPLEVNFASGTPLALPAAGEFTGLDGSARQTGIGIAIGRRGAWRLWGEFEWNAGLMWQRIDLQDYSLDFRVLDGPSQGATGTIDYSARYSFMTPFIGIAWPRGSGDWRLAPHVQIALPLPRQGVAGRISGPNYELSGDTGATGFSTPFGDPSLTIGFDVTYRPWNLDIDVGTIASQALLEPLVHEGVSRNWLISASWNF